MAPPKFEDIGKSSKDLFIKHYYFGKVKLDFKSKTSTGLEFNLNGVSDNETGLVTSCLESKYNIKQHGIVLRQKWNSDNELFGEVTAEDYCASGLKAGLQATLVPQSGKRTGRLTCGYKGHFFNLAGDVHFDHSGPVVNGSGVFGHLNWLAGMKMTYDSANNKLSRSSFVCGYQAPKYHVTGHLVDGRDLTFSTYQKLRDNLEVGVNVAWPLYSGVPKVGFGYQYRIDENSAMRVKLNTANQIGLALVNRLGPGINLTLSAMIDVKHLSHGSHSMGLGLDFEP